MTKPWTKEQITKAEKAIKAIKDGSAKYTAYTTPSGIKYAIFDDIGKH